MRTRVTTELVSNTTSPFFQYQLGSKRFGGALFLLDRRAGSTGWTFRQFLGQIIPWVGQSRHFLGWVVRWEQHPAGCQVRPVLGGGTLSCLLREAADEVLSCSFCTPPLQSLHGMSGSWPVPPPLPLSCGLVSKHDPPGRGLGGVWPCVAC